MDEPATGHDVPSADGTVLEVGSVSHVIIIEVGEPLPGVPILVRGEGRLEGAARDRPTLSITSNAVDEVVEEEVPTELRCVAGQLGVTVFLRPWTVRVEVLRVAKSVLVVDGDVPAGRDEVIVGVSARRQQHDAGKNAACDDDAFLRPSAAIRERHRGAQRAAARGVPHRLGVHEVVEVQHII